MYLWASPFAWLLPFWLPFVKLTQEEGPTQTCANWAERLAFQAAFVAAAFLVDVSGALQLEVSVLCLATGCIVLCSRLEAFVPALRRAAVFEIEKAAVWR